MDAGTRISVIRYLSLSVIRYLFVVLCQKGGRVLSKWLSFLGTERGRELVRYAAIGAATTAVNFAVAGLLILLRVGGREINVAGVVFYLEIANAAGIVASVLFAYLANKLFVFRSRVKGPAALLREAGAFFASRAATMLAEFLGVALLQPALGFWPAKILLNLVVIVANYILAKLFIFNRGGEQT